MSENHVGPSGSNTLAFLELPQRVTKPRQKGLTIVRDYGLGSFAARDLMESVGEYIDFLKFRNVLSALEGDDLVRNKIQIYRAAGVEVFTGGILFEVAVMRGKVDRLWPAISSLGFTAAEVSDNMVDISLKEKREHVRQAAAAGLKVIFEYGKKFPDAPLDLEEAADEIQSILEDGAYKVVLERSELDLLLGANADRPEIERLLQLVERCGGGQPGVRGGDDPAHGVVRQDLRSRRESWSQHRAREGGEDRTAAPWPGPRDRVRVLRESRRLGGERNACRSYRHHHH